MKTVIRVGCVCAAMNRRLATFRFSDHGRFNIQSLDTFFFFPPLLTHFRVLVLSYVYKR